MAKSFRTETQEFIQAFSSPGTLPDRVHSVIREGFDLVGKLINLDNGPVAIAEVKQELEDAARVVVFKLLSGRPVAKAVLDGSLPWLIGPAVDAVAGYTGTAEQFVDEHITPRLREWEKTISRIIKDLDG